MRRRRRSEGGGCYIGGAASDYTLPPKTGALTLTADRLPTSRLPCMDEEAAKYILSGI